MKALIIHHLEPLWEAGYRLSGTNFEQIQDDVIDHIFHMNYNRIILTRFESDRLDASYHGFLRKKVGEVYHYEYGWSPEEFSSPEEYCPGRNHSPVVHTPDWLKSLKDYEVDLCGGFDGECIEDMEVALSYLGIEYKRLEHLIV